MRSRTSSDSADEVARLQKGTRPPFIPETLFGNTRVTGPWTNIPFDAYVPELNEHVLVAHLAGNQGVWVKNGGTTLSGRMVPGTVTLVPKGYASWRRIDGVIQVSNVFLGVDRLQSCSDQVAHGQRPELLDRLGFDDPRLFAIMKLLSDEAGSGVARHRLFMEQLVDLLCLQLLRAHSALGAPAPVTVRRGLAVWQVRRVTAYMRDNIGEDFGLQELASLVGLSRFHFCRAFRLSTGYTPHGWLIRQRIDKARQLLADPRLRIIDVAIAVGYETPSAFTASFRRVTGVTPTAFRRRR
jgi:AraC family transcriptional regulator